MALPVNATEIAAAIQDGTLGVIEDVMIGDLLVSALTALDTPETLTVTRKPVQQGFTVTDAAVDNNDDIILTIVLANPQFSVEAGISAAISGSVSSFTETWTDKRNKLYQMMRDREIIAVQTHDAVYSSMLISGIIPLYDVSANFEAWLGTVTCTPYTTKATTYSGGKKAQSKAWLGGL